MTTINYDKILELAKQNGQSIKDLCALDPSNDPFYTGRNAEVAAAQWFADLWDRFGYQTGIHLRRVHYQLISQDPLILRPDTGRPYENTKSNYAYLNNAGKWARYLKLVDPAAFVDRRNPEAIIYAAWLKLGDFGYHDPTPDYFIVESWEIESDQYILPRVPTLGRLPWSLPDLPNFEISGYDGIQQDYHLEVWCEKSTMNDVLIPLCQRYKVNLITGLGEMSITAVVEFLQRVRQARRPARILYLSDYDPAGVGMPISIARKIEFFQRNEGHDDLDIRLQPIVLTPYQIELYSLPRIPVKDSDLRKENWEALHGKGAVELDALEALYPGALAEIVESAILDYYDRTLTRRAMDQKSALADALDLSRDGILAAWQDEIAELESSYSTLLTDFEATRQEFNELVKDFGPKIEAYQNRLDSILTQGEKLHENLTDALEDIDIDTDLEEYSLPSPDLPPENDNQLYDSRWDYFIQLKAYKAQREGA